jgi:histidinol-phosphate aminotransferase
MSTGYLYEPLPDVSGGARLHLNENSAGCSAAVLAAIRSVTREQIAWYPAYSSATAACARAFGVRPDSVLLTNGLDEGILTVSLALVPRNGQPAEVVVVEPGYGMYGPSAKLAGAVVRSAEPGPGLSFDLDRVIAAVTPATRFVVLSNPNNPAGAVIPLEWLRALAQELPEGAFLFVDEAYADFAGNCSIPEIATVPNLIVGRTFAKAYGLAGLRIGAVFARPEVIARLRGAIPPFSVNVFAAAALEAALNDRGYLEWYLHQVRLAKEALYDGFTRLGLAFWRSDANFVLVRVGDAPGVRLALSERGIHVRDRSSAPGCEGCIRVTAGLPDEARACVAALEEVLCAAPR